MFLKTIRNNQIHIRVCENKLNIKIKCNLKRELEATLQVINLVIYSCLSNDWINLSLKLSECIDFFL